MQVRYCVSIRRVCQAMPQLVDLALHSVPVTPLTVPLHCAFVLSYSAALMLAIAGLSEYVKSNYSTILRTLFMHRNRI